MLQITDATEMVTAVFNQMFPFDAVVIQGASESGAIYATVDAAIDAGHKSIYVRTGQYAGFTADVDRLNIVAEEVSTFAASDFTGGVEFTSTVTVSADDVTLTGLSVDTASGPGFSVTGNRCRLVDCQAALCSTDGILATTGVNMRVIRGRYVENGSDGISFSQNECWFSEVEATSNTVTGIIPSGTARARIVGCVTNLNGAYGIDQGSSGSVYIIGCFATGNSTGQINGTNACDFSGTEENVVA